MFYPEVPVETKHRLAGLGRWLLVCTATHEDHRSHRMGTDGMVGHPLVDRRVRVAEHHHLGNVIITH